jgi:hypothetical protein
LTELGSDLYATAAPNIFGDLFGSRAQQVIIPRPALSVLVTRPQVFSLTTSQALQAPFIYPNFPGSNVPQIFTFSSPYQSSGTAILSPGGQLIQSPVFTTSSAIVPNTGTGPNGATTTVALVPDASTRSQLLQAGRAQALGGEVFRLGTSSATAQYPGNNYLTADQILVNGLYSHVMSIYQPPQILEITSPAAGGVVGQTKISDGNNPLPRDRIIFDYDYFNHTQLYPGGVDVSRISAGFEKTFFDQRGSIEVRVPFASTLSSDITTNGYTDTSRIELGDVDVTLKALLYRSNVFNLAAGLGVALPTADDTQLRMANGTQLVHINNDEVTLTPFFAFLYTPNERLFFQNWYEFGIAANGNGVQANPNLTGLQDIGRLTDQSLLQIDAQLGYWLYRSQRESNTLRGLAPFVELHYNSTMGASNVVSAGAFQVGLANSHYDELNISTGVTAQLRDNAFITFGAAFPLKGNSDRSFDYQLGIRASFYFGGGGISRGAPSF